MMLTTKNKIHIIIQLVIIIDIEKVNFKNQTSSCLLPCFIM